MEAIWYKRAFNPKSYEVKLADYGVGYYRLDNWPPSVYAFRRVNTTEPGISLLECDMAEVEKLEDIRKRSQGLHLRKA